MPHTLASLKTIVLWVLGLALYAQTAARPIQAKADGPGANSRIPVILNTDIGDDIDDTWALAMLLKSPSLDLRLVTTTHGKAVYRAKIICRILEAGRRADVPVGLGAGGLDGTGAQAPWVAAYDLERYPGKVVRDGTQALIEAVEASSSPVTVISIGPSTTVASALEKRPEIARRAVFVGMQGAVRRGYDGGPVGPEYNVKENVPAARKALLAPWIRTIITPLDTCGLVRLAGARFAALAASPDPLLKTVLENYRIWSKKESLGELGASTVLFDTVAIYLALPGEKPFLHLEDLAIGVTAAGLTLIDPAGPRMSVATNWKDLEGYADYLVRVLLGS